MSIASAVRLAGTMAFAFALASAGTPAAAATSGAAPDTAAMRGALEMMRRTERAFANTTAEVGVRNGFLMFFADDAISPPDSMPARLSARPAPIAPPPTTLTWEPLTGDVSRSLDLGWLSGPFSYLDGRQVRHHGVYFSIWRRGADGLWRVALDAGIGTLAPAPEFAEAAFRPATGSRWADSLDAAHAASAVQELRRAEVSFLSAVQADPRAAYAAALSDAARLHRDGRAPLLARDSILAAVAIRAPRDLGAPDSRRSVRGRRSRLDVWRHVLARRATASATPPSRACGSATRRAAGASRSTC